MNSKREFTLSQVEKIAKSQLINRSFIAELMYPDIKASSANGKFTNKLHQNGRFKFTQEEQQRAIRIVSREIFKLLE